MHDVLRHNVWHRIGFYLIAVLAALTLSLIPQLMPGSPGISIAYSPVLIRDTIRVGLFWTLLLAGLSITIGFALGSLLGVIGAWRRGGFMDALLPPSLTFVGSFPYFFLAMMALFFLSFRLSLFPSHNAYSDNLPPELSLRFGADVLWHMALPALCIVLISLGGWLLTMRTAMIATLSQGYMLLAEAKGLPQRRVMFNYAARNALLPSLKTFGVTLSLVLSGQLLIEMVFGYPGLGSLLLQAVRTQDYPLLQGLFLTITFVVLGVNLIVDLLYIRLDPRVRHA